LATSSFNKSPSSKHLFSLKNSDALRKQCKSSVSNNRRASGQFSLTPAKLLFHHEAVKQYHRWIQFTKASKLEQFKAIDF
jgi:hypothetical protein